MCAVGIRAEESSSRAKKPSFQVRNDIMTVSLKASRGLNAEEHEQWAEEAIARWEGSYLTGRLALTWNAILDWPLERVWEMLGTSKEEVISVSLWRHHSSAEGLARALGLCERQQSPIVLHVRTGFSSRHQEWGKAQSNHLAKASGNGSTERLVLPARELAD